MTPGGDVDSMDAVLAAGSAVPAHVVASIVAMTILQRLVARLGPWPYALFALPGTLAHELSHWLVAWLLRGRPQGLDLVPRRTATGWRLGAVAFQAPWWRAGPIALAPLLLLPAAWIWIVELAAPARGGMLLAHAWIAATLLHAALPSRADLRIALPFLGACIATGLLLATAWIAMRG